MRGGPRRLSLPESESIFRRISNECLGWSLAFGNRDRHHFYAIRSTAGFGKANEDSEYAMWLPVIARSLAKPALERATDREPDKYREVLDKVKFLEGLGLPQQA
jgi:hypothetical protein